MSRRLPGLVRWYGGKGNMVAKLLPLIPKSRVYVEPYGGAASILLNRPVAPVEVYNDLDGRLTNLMRVLQSRDQFRDLLHRLKHAPYSRAEFVRAIDMQDADDPVDRAWAFFVQLNQGFSGVTTNVTKGNWSRTFADRACSAWRSRIAALRHQRERVMRVQIDQAPALDVIRYWDSADTTFYIDPPYVSEARVSGSRLVYRHEADDNHHRELVEVISNCSGRVVLSGYDSPIYAPLDDLGWRRESFAVTCSASGRVRGSRLRGTGSATRHAPRTEVVWRNPACFLRDGLFSA